MMTRRRSAVQAEQQMVRSCYRGLDVETLQRQALGVLRLLMPVEAAFFATADPETLLFTGAYAEEPLGVATPMFLANEFGTRDVNRFAALATSATHVATLDRATHQDRSSSPRSRDIMKPLGLGDELRAALIAGSECWGYLCLRRDDSPLGFTAVEMAIIARLGPHIAHGLRQAMLLRESTATLEDPGPGVVLLADDLSLIAITAEAEDLLSLIDYERSTGPPLPMAVYAVAAALHAIESGTVQNPKPPRTLVQAKDGRWLNGHGSLLSGAPGEDRIAVVIEPVEQRASVTVRLSAYGLSAREAEVAKMVLRGASTHAIVDALHISHNTVQDHLKAVFDKTGVPSRRDLVAELVGRPGS